MKHYAVIINQPEGNNDLIQQRLYERYKVAGEEDSGLYILTTSDTAGEIVSAISPDGTKLGDTLLVIEIGLTAAAGQAGSEFLKALSEMTLVEGH